MVKVKGKALQALQALGDRMLYALARRPLRDAEVRRRGFRVTNPEHRQQLEAIGCAFLQGYNLALRHRRLSTLRAELLAHPRSLRPFAFEGAAMGFGVRASLRWGARYEQFERFIEQLGSEYLYLYYVGLGWWLHVRFRRDFSGLWRCIRHLDPCYRPLCLDGYGFKLGFFHHGKQPRLLGRTLEAARACVPDTGGEDFGPFVVQGWGRSLWFLYRDDSEGRVRAIADLPPALQGEAWAGWGLAAAFTQIEHPLRTIRLLPEVPPVHRGDVLLGMTFAWTAWARCDPDLFQKALRTLPPVYRGAVEGAVIACRQALERIRRESPPHPYVKWRRYTQRAAETIWSKAERAASPSTL